MSSRALLVRRVAIFGSIVGLGVTLARLLDDRSGVARARPVLPVVDVPDGAPVSGDGGRTLLRLHWARGSDVGPVREVELDDGTRVPFRASRIRAASAAPLPSPSRDISRQALESPSLVMRRDPRTRADLESSAEDATIVSARRGILEQGPADRQVLSLEDDVVAGVRRGEAAWEFHAERAEVDLRSRTLVAPGPVTATTEGVSLEGRDLDAREAALSASLAGAGRGTVEAGSGVRLGGAAPGEPVAFRWGERFVVSEVAGPRERETGLHRYRLVLEGDAEVVQGDSRLRARRITAVLAQPPAGANGSASRPTLEELLAEGSVVLDSGRSGADGERTLQARGDRFRAVPGPDGGTVGTLEGSPRLRIVETRGGAVVSTAGASSRDPAVFTLAGDRSAVHARFPGEAAAWHEEPATARAPAVRRDLRADVLTLVADRATAEGDYTPRDLLAEGAADLREGARHATARRIALRPLPGGGSAARLEGDVAATLPGMGAMDPLSTLEVGGGPADPSGEGSLLVTTPGYVEVDLPGEGGGTVVARGGALVRRVVGEREVYRLAAEMLQADLAGPRRDVRLLDARGSVRLSGEGEGKGRRRYDIAGERLLVTTADGGERPDAARVDGAPDRPAVLVVAGEDGAPLRVAGSVLRFDRATGRFRAEGPVLAEGVLPARDGAPAEAPSGPATLRCGALEGTLEDGTGGRTTVRALRASDGVRVEAGGDVADGDTLVHDGGTGTCELRGGPARVFAAPRRPLPDPSLRDTCEGPVLRLSMGEARIEAARADEGGVCVVHVVQEPPPDAPAGTPPQFLRVRAACAGPLVHSPVATSLERDVAIARWSLAEDGRWVPWETVEGVDRLDLGHDRSTDPAAPLSATATSAASRITAADAQAGWKATGVSRVALAGDRAVLEALPGAPRFRFDHASSAHEYRRVVYDRRTRTVVEAAGATVVSK